jgi:hypothetical protein
MTSMDIKHELTELRVRFARSGLDDEKLKDLIAKLDSSARPDDIGNAVRKLLDMACRRLDAGAHKFEQLGAIIDRLVAQPHPEQATAWSQFLHYARFIKYFGNNAVHETPMDTYDCQAMLPAICKLCTLMLELRPVQAAPEPVQPAPAPAQPAWKTPNPAWKTPNPALSASLVPKVEPAIEPARRTSPSAPSDRLWLGSVPPATPRAELLQVAGDDCTNVFIKKSYRQTMCYAILQFDSPEQAAAAKVHIEEATDYLVRYKY